MASKISTALSLFTITTLLVLLSKASETHNKKTEFLDHLKGCHKGDKVQGIQDLKKYLEKFGYLNGYSNNDDFDDQLESAIKTYQINHHLKATGALDGKTVTKMMMPRCGVADIINGTTSMRSGKKRHPHYNGGGHGSTHTVGHFSFFQGNPKWSAAKYHLTYGFAQDMSAEAMGAVSRAFATWADNTHFSFSQAQSVETADLKISFVRGDHGDGIPFNGSGWAIAHAFAPTNGRFHYDADETWAVGAVEGAFDLKTVALHEIGHLLGLHHSSVEGDVMLPEVRTGFTQSLHADDIQGIKALYNT